MTEKLANDTIEGVNYLLQQEDRLPKEVVVKVSTLFDAERRIFVMQKALEDIVRATNEWDANKLGSVHIQRKRWLRCGQKARDALEQIYA